MDKCLKDLPSSIYHRDEWKEGKEDPFTRTVDANKTMSPYDFDAVQNPEILTKTNIYKPLK